MPTIRSDVVGYMLHPIDLAVNKLLALDPGYTPFALLEMRRR